MILYKYFQEKKYADMWLNGEMFFSPINYYRSLEKSNPRCDKAENSIFVDEEALDKRGFEIKINEHVFSKEGGLLGFSIIDTVDDQIVVCSFSTELSQDLRNKFGVHVVRFDASEVLEFFKKHSPKRISHGLVEYTNDLSSFPTPFKKRIKFTDEKEFRIVVKVGLNEIVEGLNHYPLRISGPNGESLLKSYFSYQS